jgi:hypothetical protein
MARKQISISERDLGALKIALRVRIVYLQSFREQAKKKGLLATERAIMDDVACLTKIADDLDETPFQP